jgi:hypothetical protein
LKQAPNQVVIAGNLRFDLNTDPFIALPKQNVEFIA